MKLIVTLHNFANVQWYTHMLTYMTSTLFLEWMTTTTTKPRNNVHTCAHAQVMQCTQTQQTHTYTPFSILWLSTDSHRTHSLNAIPNLLTVATRQPTESHAFSITANEIKNLRCVTQNIWHSLQIRWHIDILFILCLRLPLDLQTSMAIKQMHFASKPYFLVKYNS